MSALDELKEKQARGEQLTSLEFTTWWCTDTVAAGHAAEELADRDAERDNLIKQNRILKSACGQAARHIIETHNKVDDRTNTDEEVTDILDKAVLQSTTVINKV